MLYAVGALSLILGLIISIALHEYGHMSFAQRYKVKVIEFMVGFGPILYSRVNKKGVKVGVRAIPLGGFIRMAGMFPPQSKLYSKEESINLGENELEFYKIHPIKKIIIMFAGPAANLFLSFIFLAIAILIVGIPTPTNTIAEIPNCLPQLANDTLCKTPPSKEAGLAKGDKILSINGEKINKWEDLVALLDKNRGSKVPLQFERAKNVITSNVVIAEINEQGYLGVRPQIEYKAGTLFSVFNANYNLASLSFSAIKRFPEKIVEVSKVVFTDKKRDPEGPIGVVGLTRISGEIANSEEVVRDKLLSLLLLLAGLNMSLFIFNLLPLVPLDGGNAFMAFIELLKRPFKGKGAESYYFDPAKSLFITYIVAAILLGTSFLLFIADIFKPISL
jgi:membrane-associated protease RseP (regulator of RpoE activity)